jgi:Sep-tRNA:Cys-tRNA synthetase
VKCAAGIEAREVEELFINLDPIQAGGRLTPEAMKAVIAYGDGYSVCDHCEKPFRLDYIHKPPIAEFHTDLAEWLGMDVVRVVPGARRGFQAVAASLVNRGDPVMLTALSHYTEFLAMEQSGGVVREIPKDAANLITPEATAERIEEVVGEFGRPPTVLFAEAVDYQYGNVHDIRGIARVAHQYDIPVLCNGAYSVGVMPVNGRELGVDFLVGSGHKSMAAPAPSGLLATTAEYADTVFRTTASVGDLTGRTFGIKEVEMMGCTLMGVTVVGMMASVPAVRERVLRWDEEVAISNEITDTLLSIGGTAVQSEMPRRHTLTRIDTRDSFDEVAQQHKKRGFFLYSELRSRGITGIIPGSTRVWKYNTYGISRRQAAYVATAFKEIAEENGLNVS